MLASIARFCYNRRRSVLVGWLLALVLVSFLSKTVGGKETTNFSVPGTESQQAVDLLKSRFPARSGDTADIVFAAPGAGGVYAVRSRIDDAVAAARAANRHVSGAVSPFDPNGVHQISPDGHVAYAEIRLDTPTNDLQTGVGPHIRAAISAAAGNGPGLQLSFGGSLFQTSTPPGATEAIGLLAAMIILLVVFGSLLAMAMPLFIAVFSIVIGLALVALLANVMEIASATGFITAMIGIGVGIDYALFIVTRYRQGLHDGMTPADAASAAVSTSGRAVLFAGCTVVISLMGLFLMGLSFVNGLAIGAGLAVLITMVASVTLLPAMFGFIGHNIDKLRLPFLHAAGGGPQGFWWSWSRRIQRRPWPIAMAALVLLLVLAFPVARLRLGFPDQGNDPPGSTTRSAYHTLASGFGPGYNGPLVVVASLTKTSDLAVVQRLDGLLRADPGAAAVSPAQPNASGAGAVPTAAIINVTPRTAPQDAATTTWVRHVRNDIIRPAVAGTDVVVKTTGTAALNIDVSAKVSSRLPWFFGAVIVLSFLLLMAVFRSVLVPLKAAIMNLLSIGATCGILVAVFEWGWGGSIIGVTKQPIAPFLPMMLFAILFGLSMDYEVFLLSRVKEEHDRTHDNGLAVANGLAATARVITAAAAIMVTVFFSFVLLPDPLVKLFGLGLGTAIVIDVTVVRMVLVPATMELLGEANWWLPRWLDNVIPRMSVDGEPAVAAGADPDEAVLVLAGR